MTDSTFYNAVLMTIFVLAPVSFASLMWRHAPYGRYASTSRGPFLSARAGWILMEAPASLSMLFFYARGSHADELVPVVLLLMWQAHYIHRAFIYPLSMRASPNSRMPWSIASLSILYQVANGYLNGSWVGGVGSYSRDWLVDPRFLIGSATFAAGYVINRWADGVLRSLRKPGESGYRIPHGGLYELISCPNYLGEILVWTGWAIATWSLAGLSFALITVANLVPRAITHHRWYRQRFADYPAERRAVLPFVL